MLTADYRMTSQLPEQGLVPRIHPGRETPAQRRGTCPQSQSEPVGGQPPGAAHECQKVSALPGNNHLSLAGCFLCLAWGLLVGPWVGAELKQQDPLQACCSGMLRSTAKQDDAEAAVKS